MDAIQDFVLVRRDGREIPEGMTAGDMAKAGWQVEPLVKAAWNSRGQAVAISLTPGSLAQVVAGRHYVATIMKIDGPSTHLLIFDASGNLHIELPPVQTVNSKEEEVTYAWFETSSITLEDTFIVSVFLRRGVTYNLIVNAKTGFVKQAGESR